MAAQSPSPNCPAATQLLRKAPLSGLWYVENLAAAVVVGVAYSLALADLDAGFRVVGSCGAHALLDLSGHGQEGLFDIAGVLGRGLEEWDAQAVGEFLGKVSNVRRLRCCLNAGTKCLVHSIAARRSWGDQRTLATVYSTTFLSVISLLLPTSSLFTPSVA